MNIDQIPLFSTLPSDERQCLADILHPIDFPALTLLCTEGEVGDRMFIIITGEVEVIQALGTEDERTLNILHPGEYFGEMSLLERQGRRSASVRASTPVKVLEMSLADLDGMLQRWPQLAIDMLRELSLRLRDTEQATIRDLQEKNRQLNQAYQELQSAQAQIIEKERLERELQVAREIQMSILPDKLPIFDGYDFGAQILPARAVGGDLYDFVTLNQHNLGIMIGDVSDKGVPAALFMALTSSLLRAEASLDLQPSEVLLQVNRHLMDMNHAKMFVTALYGILSPESGKFDYARAGHETPLLVTADGETWSPPRNAGQILGIFPDPLIDEQSITIPPGGTLILYTDGVTDSTNDQGEFFDCQGMETVLQENHHLSAQELCEKMMAEILQHQGSSPQQDDITVVAIKASAINK